MVLLVVLLLLLFSSFFVTLNLESTFLRPAIAPLSLASPSRSVCPVEIRRRGHGGRQRDRKTERGRERAEEEAKLSQDHTRARDRRHSEPIRTNIEKGTNTKVVSSRHVFRVVVRQYHHDIDSYDLHPPAPRGAALAGWRPSWRRSMPPALRSLTRYTLSLHPRRRAS